MTALSFQWIIPFFLIGAYWYSGNDKAASWKYGPEFNFKVDVTISLIPEGETPAMYTNVDANLKCRPAQSEKSLLCRLDDSTIVTEEHPEPSKFEFDVGPFEINFNEIAKIESLTVSRSVSYWRLNMVRMIAAQMDIGVDFWNTLELPQRVYKIRENLTVGECDVSFQVNRGFINQKPHKFKHPDFKGLMAFALTDFTSDNGIRIVKSIDPKSCDHKQEYFFSSDDTENVEIIIKSSINTIEIAETYTSETVITGKSVVLKNHLITSARQVIKLTLTDIQPAGTKLPEISDPTITSICVYDTVDGINHIE